MTAMYLGDKEDKEDTNAFWGAVGYLDLPGQQDSSGCTLSSLVSQLTLL